MALGQIGLKAERLFRGGPGFLRASGQRLNRIKDPAFQMRQTCMRKREGRVEPDRLVIERFDSGQIIVVSVWPVKNLVCLLVKEVGLAVLASACARAAPVRQARASP